MTSDRCKEKKRSRISESVALFEGFPFEPRSPQREETSRGFQEVMRFSRALFSPTQKKVGDFRNIAGLTGFRSNRVI